MNFPELRTIIEETKKIEPIEENFNDLQQINTSAQTLMIITGHKLSDIWRERQRLAELDRELPFEYDRRPFEGLP
jgi:hypothetical protein